MTAGNGNGNGGSNLAHARVTEIMLASPDGKALLERIDGATGECVGPRPPDRVGSDGREGPGVMAVLERTAEQRLSALEVANDIRVRRAQLKRDIRAGGQFMALVWEPPAWLHTMKVYDLLRAVPKLGVHKAEQIMRRLKIAHQKTVGGMSERQRVDLLTELAGRGGS